MLIFFCSFGTRVDTVCETWGGCGKEEVRGGTSSLCLLSSLSWGS